MGEKIKAGNPYSVIFDSRFRNEFLNWTSLVSLLGAKVLGEEDRQNYHGPRPTLHLVTRHPMSSRNPHPRLLNATLS